MDSDHNDLVALEMVPFGGGIPNIGNTCFANAVLMCLFHDEEMTRALLVGPMLGEIEKVGDSVKLLRSYVKLLNVTWNNESVELLRVGVTSLMSKVYKDTSLSRRFEPKRQEDADDFLSYILEKLHDELELFAQHHVATSGVSASLRRLVARYSLVTRQTYTCQWFNHERVINDTGVLKLSLQNTRKSIEECIEENFRASFLQCLCVNEHSDANQLCKSAYRCNQCNAYVDATLTPSIVSPLPDILVINLMRFRFIDQYNVSRCVYFLIEF